MQAIQIRSTLWAESSTQKRHWPFLKRVLIQNAHPTKLILKTIGGIWGVYFLWDLKWQLALAIVIGAGILGSVLTWGADEEELAATKLGKLVMTHWHPFTMSFHVLASITLIIGIMSHATLWILSVVSLYLFGHLWGWQKEDQL